MKSSSILHRSMFFTAVLAAAPLQAAPLPPDLLKASHRYDLAQLHGDRGELERLLADDYTLVNSQAKTEDKAALIADYTDPAFKLDPFTIEEPVEKIWSDGAVLGGIVTLSGASDGKRFQTRLRFADVWARRKGRWQVVFTAVTPIPEASIKN